MDLKLDMELRHLRYFKAVAECGSFSGAARAIYVSQSALSEQVADLERELGVPLFDRSERKLRLTPHGEIFVRESDKVLEGADRAVAVVRRSFRGEVGTLRVGFFAGGLGAQFAGLIRRFRNDRPGVQVSLVEKTPMEQTQALLEGSIDVAFTRRVAEPFAKELRSETLRHHRLDAVLPKHHPLAKGPVDIRALSTERFVLCARETAPAVFDKIIGLCSEAGFSPQIAALPMVRSSALMLVQAGEGISIVPELHDVMGSGLSAWPLRSKGAFVELVMAWSPRRVGPILDAFMGLVRENKGQL
jgi:DNA-binding transcriptional LysR family regulator